MRWLKIALASSTLTACGGSSPPAPPVVNPPASNETINGTERIGWDQPAADTVELATIRYAIYVDDVRSEIAGVTCATTSASNAFVCTGRLPTLTRGAHTLQIASFTANGAVLESARSAALRVNVVAAASSSVATVRPGATIAAGGVRLPVELVADGLDAPSDFAFTPDGRLFIAQAAGRIRIVRDGHLLQEPG